MFKGAKMKRRVLTGLFLIGAFLGVMLILIYFLFLPLVVSNEKIVNNVAKLIIPSKIASIKIESPNLKTHINSDINFKAKKIHILKDSENVFEMDNLNVGISLKGLFANKLIVNDFRVDNIFVDSNKLIDIFPSDNQNNKKQNNDISLDLYDSILGIKKGLILYSINKTTNIKVELDNIFADNREKKERFIHFDIKTQIQKPNNKINKR